MLSCYELSSAADLESRVPRVSAQVAAGDDEESGSNCDNNRLSHACHLTWSSPPEPVTGTVPLNNTCYESRRRHLCLLRYFSPQSPDVRNVRDT